MGGEGGGFAGEEIEEAQGRHRGTGESAQLSGYAEQVRHNTEESGWETSSFASQGVAARYLLQSLEMAGSPVASRTQASGVVPISVLRKAEGGVHQSLSLQESRESGFAACTGAETLGVRAWPLAPAVPAASGNDYAAQRVVLVERFQRRHRWQR